MMGSHLFETISPNEFSFFLQVVLVMCFYYKNRKITNTAFSFILPCSCPVVSMVMLAGGLMLVLSLGDLSVPQNSDGKFSTGIVKLMTLLVPLMNTWIVAFLIQRGHL